MVELLRLRLMERSILILRIGSRILSDRIVRRRVLVAQRRELLCLRRGIVWSCLRMIRGR